MCAPHRVRKSDADLTALEVAGGTVVDDRPIVDHTLRHFSREIREVVSPSKGNVQRCSSVKLVATVGGAKAEAKANGVVTTLGSNHHADLLPPPIADILKDSVVRRISHTLFSLVVVDKKSRVILTAINFNEDRLLPVAIRRLPHTKQAVVDVG